MPDRLLNLEQTYKPQYLKNRLKPPKHTQTSKLRNKKPQEVQKMLTRTLTHTSDFAGLTRDNLQQASQSFYKQRVGEEIEAIFASVNSLNEADCRAQCLKVIKAVYGSDVKFDDETYKMTFAVLKFDQGDKSLDKYEFTQLVNQVAKQLTKEVAAAPSEISSAKIHRAASASALKPTQPAKIKLPDQVRIRSQCIQLFKLNPTKAVYFKTDVLKHMMTVFTQAGIPMTPQVLEE